MNATQVLLEVERQGIRLTVQGDHLSCHHDREIPAWLMDEMKKNKPLLRAYLSQPDRIGYLNEFATESQWGMVPADMSIAELYDFLHLLTGDRTSGHSPQECLTHYRQWWPSLPLEACFLKTTDSTPGLKERVGKEE